MLELVLFYKKEHEVEKVESTEIVWKEGMDVTKKKVKKKQKNKKTGETRTIVKTVESESFFNLFKNMNSPEGAESDPDEEQAD